MINKRRKLNTFFKAYEERFNHALTNQESDTSATAHSFAKHFIEASPLGIIHGKNNFMFRWMMKRGQAFYRKIGMRSMKIVSKDFSDIDYLHTMVKIHWLSEYDRKSDGKDVKIEFDVTYFVQHINDDIKIFAFVTGDEQKVLKEHGLT